MKLALITSMALGSLVLLPLLGTTQQTTRFYGDKVLNPFEQPNVKTGGRFNLDYYGSGDTDGNDSLTWNDYNLMVSGVQNDRTDIDGDGVMSTTADKQMLSDLLNGQTPTGQPVYYLPAHWNLLQYVPERNFWVDRAKAIDQTDKNVWSTSYDCDEFSFQTWIINFSGIENISNAGINLNTYDTTTNARFNIPAYWVSTVATNNKIHRIGDIVTGDSVQNFTAHYFIEPQSDAKVIPGDYSMHKDYHANLSRKTYVHTSKIKTHTDMTLINFDLKNGKDSVTIMYPWGIAQKRKIVPVDPQGILPSDTIINLKDYVHADSIKLNVAGLSEGADALYTDSIVTLTAGDFDIYRTWTLKPYHEYVDTSQTVQREYPYHWLDKTIGTTKIEVRYNKAPVLTYVPSDTVVKYGADTDTLNTGSIRATDKYGVNYFYSDSTDQDADVNKIGHYNYTIFRKHSAENKSLAKKKTDYVQKISVEKDSPEFTFFPEDLVFNYGEPADTSKTGAAQFKGHEGIPVSYSIVDSTNQDPDSTKCGHYDYTLFKKHSIEDIVEKKDSIQKIDFRKPNSLQFTYVPKDTIVSKDVDIYSLDEATGKDTLMPLANVNYTYSDEIVKSTYELEKIKRTGTLEDVCGQTKDTSWYITRDLVDAIEEMPGVDILSPYPNPTNGNLTVPYTLNHKADIQVEIWGMGGRKLEERIYDNVTPGKHKVNVNMEGYAPGVYLLRVGNDEIGYDNSKVVVGGK